MRDTSGGGTANQFRVTLDWLDDRGYQFTREGKRYLAQKIYATD